jgi:hypothetical protein
MGSVPPVLSFLLMAVSGWFHRRHLSIIELLQAENRLVEEKMKGKRIRFTDAERALPARKAKVAPYRFDSGPTHQGPAARR